MSSGSAGTNNTSINNNNNNNNGNNNGNLINYVALVIAVVALVASTLQVLQQYLASAGYSSVGEKVMGGWHTTKRRRFRLKEFRFEVLFESPIIFVSPPDNTKGPVRDTAIMFLDGRPAPDLAALTTWPRAAALRPEPDDPRSSLSTAYSERATWLTMLDELQAMERDSEAWQAAQHRRGPPCGGAAAPAPFAAHSLCVAIQRKKRSWDMMPRDVKRPYATTTMCHIVEIAAMMGIHWLEFARTKNKFLAVGNGLTLTGRLVNDLGIMFTFHISQKSRWQGNRCIPTDAVKDLCFGFLPTIFQPDGAKNIRRLDTSGENRDLGLLQLGSTNDVAEAMMLLGCNTDTSKFFRSPTGQHTHLFPLTFELVGMIGQVLHIKDTCFRMLPNPTPHHWDKKFFSLRRLTTEFRNRIEDAESYDLYPHVPQMASLLLLADRVVKALGTSRLAAHSHQTAAAAASRDTYDDDDKAADFSFPLLRTLHEAIDRCDAYLRHDVPEDLVVMVVREHLQHVMAMLNHPEQFEPDASNSDDDDSASHRTARSGRPVSVGNNRRSGPGLFFPAALPGGASDRGRTRHFAELSAASPELRQAKFMDLYFSVVLGHVREQAVRAFRRRKSTDYSMLLPPYRSRVGSISAPDVDRPELGGRSEDISRATTGEEGRAGQQPASAAAENLQPQNLPKNETDAEPVMGTPRQSREEGEPRAPLPQRSTTVLEPGEKEPDSPETAVEARKVPELRVTRAAAAAALAAASPRNEKVRTHPTQELDELASTIWCTLQFRMLLWLMLHDFHKKDVQISKSELYGSRLPVYVS